jgi:alpha-L-rhamnosidase
MKQNLVLCLFIIILCSCNNTDQPGVSVTGLKCNWQTNPVGTVEELKFNWNGHSIMRANYQTAYQVIVGTNPKSLTSDENVVWNSGKVISRGSTGILYNGIAPATETEYFWKVRIWDKNDSLSSWSETASFITGLRNPSDWSGARWIGYETIPDSLMLVPGVHGNGNNLGNVAVKRITIPLFRKEFKAEKKIRQAIAFVSGLGQYELTVNGEKTSGRFLSPGWTDYRKTILYNTYDITRLVRKGPNVVGIIAGNGFFNINRERYRKLVIAYGAPMVIMKVRIEYNDGTIKEIITDDTWKTSASPITYSGIYGGEDYDARLVQPGWDQPGFNDVNWTKALIVTPPAGKLEPESDHPVTINQSFDPVKISVQAGGWFVWDFGQNASGIVKLTVSGKPGQILKIFPGELLGDDSLVTQRATGSPYYFQYTLKGGKEELWTPKFTYYGFRYAGVTGAVPDGFANPSGLPVIKHLQFLHTRNSSPSAGSFTCSNELFNKIYDLINWSVKSNLASVATDCPHREKLGWLEQTHLMGNSIRYLYDIRNLYSKIVDDMIGAQLDNGLVPDIAPEYVTFSGGFRDSPEWGSACIILPWDMYNWYGDIDVVKKAYPMMKKYAAYLDGKSKGHILSHGLGDWFDLGPNSPGEAQLTPKEVTATSIYFYDVKLLASMAKLIGEQQDADLYNDLSEKIRKAFNDKFFDKKTMVYSSGSQTAMAMPLFFGMDDEKHHKEIVGNLIRSIEKGNKALTSGDVGYRYLLRVLEQEGYSGLISEMNARSDVPGYGYQLAKGATSLTESWAALRFVSNNHMMLGHLMEWFYSGAGGIKQFFNEIGECCIEISPEPVENIKWANTSYNSVNGKISCEWKNREEGFSLKTEIPFGCNAIVIIPGDNPEKIIVNGVPSLSNPDIVYLDERSGRSRFRIGSGEYCFESHR